MSRPRYAPSANRPAVTATRPIVWPTRVPSWSRVSGGWTTAVPASIAAPFSPLRFGRGSRWPPGGPSRRRARTRYRRTRCRPRRHRRPRSTLRSPKPRACPGRSPPPRAWSSCLPGGGPLRSIISDSEPSFDSPTNEAKAQPADDDRYRDHDSGIDAVTRDCVGDRLAAVVGDQADHRRPDAPARRVPEQKPPPGHAGEAGDPRDRVAEHCHEPTEEHRRAPVACHQFLGGREDAVAVLVQPAP